MHFATLAADPGAAGPLQAMAPAPTAAAGPHSQPLEWVSGIDYWTQGLSCAPPACTAWPELAPCWHHCWHRCRAA